MLATADINGATKNNNTSKTFLLAGLEVVPEYISCLCIVTVLVLLKLKNTFQVKFFGSLAISNSFRQ